MHTHTHAHPDHPPTASRSEAGPGVSSRPLPVSALLVSAIGRLGLSAITVAVLWLAVLWAL